MKSPILCATGFSSKKKGRFFPLPSSLSGRNPSRASAGSQQGPREDGKKSGGPGKPGKRRRRQPPAAGKNAFA